MYIIPHIYYPSPCYGLIFDMRCWKICVPIITWSWRNGICCVSCYVLIDIFIDVLSIFASHIYFLLSIYVLSWVYGQVYNIYDGILSNDTISINYIKIIHMTTERCSFPYIIAISTVLSVRWNPIIQIPPRILLCSRTRNKTPHHYKVFGRRIRTWKR